MKKFFYLVAASLCIGGFTSCEDNCDDCIDGDMIIESIFNRTYEGSFNNQIVEEVEINRSDDGKVTVEFLDLKTSNLDLGKVVLENVSVKEEGGKVLLSSPKQKLNSEKGGDLTKDIEISMDGEIFNTDSLVSIVKIFGLSDDPSKSLDLRFNSGKPTAPQNQDIKDGGDAWKNLDGTYTGTLTEGTETFNRQITITKTGGTNVDIKMNDVPTTIGELPLTFTNVVATENGNDIALSGLLDFGAYKATLTGTKNNEGLVNIDVVISGLDMNINFKGTTK